ncbi:MAG: phospholipase D-like domain-containing protein [Spirochaetia bacterium]|nr:phospholipase D-like domain-containing protein [Spirochaetia bacterium]
MIKKIFKIFILFALIMTCSKSPFGEPDGDLRADKVKILFNDPGRNLSTVVNKKIDEELTYLIDKAEKSVYIAVYQLSRENLINAILGAFERKIDVKIVAEMSEFSSEGYQRLYSKNIPMTFRDSSGIQHNKFVIIDESIVFTGTGNFTDNGFLRNNNNFVILKERKIAEYYLQEFLQMQKGFFGSYKKSQSAENDFISSESQIEIYFSPYQGKAALKRLVEIVNNARHTIHYMGFSFTNDALSSALIRAAKQRNVFVYGIHDFNFTARVSEEAPRLYSAGFNNDLSKDIYGPHVYIGGGMFPDEMGGKVHCKTIIVDAGYDTAVSATGSFNWSDNAIEKNDENLLVLFGKEISETLYEQWQTIYNSSRTPEFLLTNISGRTAAFNDIVISEIGWAGSSGAMYDKDDDFIELYNKSADFIDLAHWSVEVGEVKRDTFTIPDVFNGYYSSDTVIGPGEFKILYSSGSSAFAVTDYVNLNTFSNVKLSGSENFRLNRGDFKIRLFDKAMNLIDEAGDATIPFAGYYDESLQKTYSMNRAYFNSSGILDGGLKSAWYSSISIIDCAQSNLPLTECQSFAADTYASAGYAGLDNPSVNALGAVLIDSKNILLTFSGNMSNCTGSDLFTVNACDIASTSISSTSSEGVLVSFLNDCLGNASLVYEITPTLLCKDFLLNSAAGTFFINGFDIPNNGKKADVVINEISMKDSTADWVELYVKESGTLQGLRLYEYNHDVKELLYEFHEMYVNAGDYIIVKTNQSENNRALSEDLFADCLHDFLAPCTVYSTDNGLDGTDSSLILENNAIILDGVYYSNNDGDVSEGMMNGALQYFFNNLAHVWPLSQKPVNDFNDANIQQDAVDISLVNSDSKGIKRISDGLSPWIFTSNLTMGTPN